MFNDKKYNPLETFLISILFVFQRMDYLIPILLLTFLSTLTPFISFFYSVIAVGGTYLMFKSNYDSNFNIKELDKDFILKKCYLAWSFFSTGIIFGVLILGALNLIIDIPVSFMYLTLWFAVGVSAIAITNDDIKSSYLTLFKETFNNYLCKKDVIPLLTVAMFVGGIHSIFHAVTNGYYLIDAVFVSFVSVVYIFSVMSYYRLNN